MVSIYTISDKALMGKQINLLSAYIAECFFKSNIKTDKQCVIGCTADFSKCVDCNDILIFLVDKSCDKLNQYICDVTKSVIIENPYAKNSIYAHYKKLNQPMEKEVENEWKMPSQAQAIVNPINTTQGYILEHNNTIYCVLPNIYDEARIMFDDVVLDYILKEQKKKYRSYTFKSFGLGIDLISKVIEAEIKNKSKVSINLFEKPMEVDIVLKSIDTNKDLDDIAKSVFLKLDKYIYSVEDIPIEKVVYKLLKLNEIKVSFAEDISCGEICSHLVKQADDAVNYIDKSIVVPNIESKMTTLGIDKSLIDTQGEVSPNVVYQMAVNLIKNSNADVVVANVGKFTATNNAQNGLCYIAVGDRKEIHVYKNVFKGNYKDIIDSATVSSYFYLIKKLKKNDFHLDKNTI